MVSVDLLDVRIDVIDREGLHEVIERSVLENRRRVLAYVNVHAMNLARKDDGFRRFLNEADVVYCDGEGVRVAAQLKGVIMPQRIVLTYWIDDLCRFCEEKGLSIFLLGSATGIVDRAMQNLRERFQRLKIAGFHHGYFEKTGAETDDVIGLINKARPDILFVGFGMPLQERWIQTNLDRLDVRAILPCGSMIDYAAGEKHYAPAWMADHGLEWLYRLMQEPGRLWRRYLFGNPLFALRVIRESVLQRRGG